MKTTHEQIARSLEALGGKRKVRLIYCAACEQACSPEAEACPGCGHPLLAKPPIARPSPPLARPVPSYPHALGAMTRRQLIQKTGWPVLSNKGRLLLCLGISVIVLFLIWPPSPEQYQPTPLRTGRVKRPKIPNTVANRTRGRAREKSLKLGAPTIAASGFWCKKWNEPKQTIRTLEQLYAFSASKGIPESEAVDSIDESCIKVESRDDRRTICRECVNSIMREIYGRK